MYTRLAVLLVAVVGVGFGSIREAESQPAPTVPDLDATTPSVPASATPPAVDEVPATVAIPAAPAAPEKPITEQLAEAKAAFTKLKAASPEEKTFAVTALIAVLLNLLLTGVKKVMKLTPKGKQTLPWVALGIGVGIAVLEKYGLDGSWVTALVYGAAGPGAVFFQELLGRFNSTKPAAA